MKENWEEVEKTVLKRRAAELAKPLDDQAEITEVLPVLEFVLMGMRYSVILDKIEAVTRIGEIISIPLTPRHISGIIRRRGVSFTLVSLRHFFNRNAEGLADADFAVIVSAKGKKFALQVEDIEGVIHVPKAGLLPAPDNFDAAQAPYVSAVTTDGLVVLDVDRFVEAKGFSMDSPT
ncbi:MAG: chemotaxis protein CheW [Myxococcota bacterium]|nr:chemotaxis protein CheW [Myxococcota bacterium]